jgi:hypothetical protein
VRDVNVDREGGPLERVWRAVRRAGLHDRVDVETSIKPYVIKHRTM